MIGHSIFANQSEYTKPVLRNFKQNILFNDTVTMHFGVCHLSKAAKMLTILQGPNVFFICRHQNAWLQCRKDRTLDYTTRV